VVFELGYLSVTSLPQRFCHWVFD